MTDEITKASMVALLARWQLAWVTQQAQTAIRDAANAKLKDCSKTIADCKESAKTLGFDRDDKEQWFAAIAEFYPEARKLYMRAKAPDMPDWGVEIPEKPAQTSDASASPEAEPGAEAEKRSRPSIRSIVLERLEQAGETGAKAAELREHIETTYEENIHEKTVGMTLYRLLQDELVRRQGHTWFIVPHQGAETVNPGAATPGLQSETEGR